MASPERSSASIAVFDSGFGGLTVMRALHKLLPNENIIYLGDAARLPYGSKSPDTVIRYTLESSLFLAKQNIKLLVIACHTASSVALPSLMNEYVVPMVGMVDPCLDELCSQKGPIAILGTQATISSQIYQKALKNLQPKITVQAVACPLFVPIVEEGLVDSPIALESIKHYLLSVKEQNIETVLLACTHYPLMQHVIQSYLGNKCRLIDPAVNCAEHVRQILQSAYLMNEQTSLGTFAFYTTDDPEKFKRLGESFLGKKINYVERVTL